MFWVIVPIIIGGVLYFSLASIKLRTAGLALVCLGIIVGAMKVVAAVSLYTWILIALAGLAAYYWTASRRISPTSIRRM